MIPQVGVQRRASQEGDMAKKKIPAPEGLKETGKKLWGQLTEKYIFRFDELQWLEAACTSLDRLDDMRSELRGLGYMLSGSQGQDVVNPIVAEIRATEAHVSALLARLKLPDEEGATVSNLNQHREAAKSKWATAHGKGA